MADTLDESFHVAIIARAQEALQHWQVPVQQPLLLKYRENAVFRITLADGRFAALRLHRPGYHEVAALHSELEWMAALHGDGIDVPNALPDREGLLVVELPASVSFSSQHADIISWMGGAQLGETGVPLPYPQSERDALFRQIGATMADLHNSADAWQPPAEFYRPAWDADGLVGEKPLWGRFWDCDFLSIEQSRQLSQLRGQLQKALASIVESDLDYGLIHADLIRENVLVKNGDVSFIDFDDCGYGFRMFDIATALLKNRAEQNYTDLEKSLIEGYRSKRHLSDAALETLPLFLTLRSLTYIGWLWERPELPDVQARLERYVRESLQLADTAGYSV